MVTFVKILPDSLRPAIKAAFEGDIDLIDKYHVVNGDLQICVEDTERRIQEVSENDPLEFFALYYGKVLIGFTVIGDSFLLSFGINIRYRVKYVVLGWWNWVSKLLDYEFATWIFKKNTRTIEFLKRNGMKIVQDNNDEYYNLVYINKTE
jgi:hypothetical protein